MGLTKLEKYLESYLVRDLGEETGKSYYANYQQAKTYLSKNILPEIKAIEPSLTDHSEKHIENVLNNVWHLLDIENNDNIKLTCYDIYILCLSVLFHDVGNINGRKDHNKKVTDIYNLARGNAPQNFSERALILKATRAHCGKTNSGSRDTLKEIEIVNSLSGEPIQLLEISSILRLADELAEGPQRTSDYLFSNIENLPEKKVKNKLEKSRIYHKYAQITDVFIDRGNDRIVLKYHIDIEDETPDSFRELLSYTYERIIKLDEERRYTKFYSKILDPFKKTEVTFNYTRKGEPLDISIDKIVLHDTCVIPGANQPCITNLVLEFSTLNIDNIISQLDIK
jgi:hypothetical protein